MRKKSLRQTANHYIQNNRSGCLRDKKQRRYIIYKLIDDLFYLGNTPSTWDALPHEHFHKLIALWQKKKIKSSTIMNHMVIIRTFLMSLGYDTSMLGNQN
ncbi:MAG: phage integrase N-terminal domain-containing protein, partial [Legionella sp.]|nr:phage integrase N-terminal domain-containing protein [Legionella sp.]